MNEGKSQHSCLLNVTSRKNQTPFAEVSLWLPIQTICLELSHTSFSNWFIAGFKKVSLSSLWKNISALVVLYFFHFLWNVRPYYLSLIFCNQKCHFRKRCRVSLVCCCVLEHCGWKPRARSTLQEVFVLPGRRSCCDGRGPCRGCVSW